MLGTSSIVRWQPVGGADLTGDDSLRQLICTLRFREIARWAAISATLAAILLSISMLRAADPAFVGILALATDDTVAQRLALSDEVKAKLRQLVQKRENAAIDLALSIKDLPPDERARRLAPFVQESERLGMELLTLEQRSKLSQLRLQRSGMASLAEPDMAQLLELSPPQQAEIRRLLGERAVAMTRGGEQERRVARDRYERSLRMILTDAQKATWDQMAGLGPGPTKVTEPAKPTEGTAIAGQGEMPAAQPAAHSAPPVPPSGDQPAASLPAEDMGATGTAPATEGAPAPPAVEPATPQTPAELTPAGPQPAADAELAPAAGVAEAPLEPAAATPAPAAQQNPLSPSDIAPAPAPPATVTDQNWPPRTKNGPHGRQVTVQFQVPAVG